MLGAVWAMFAVIGGFRLAIAAIAFWRRRGASVADEYTIGYNLLSTQIPTQNR